MREAPVENIIDKALECLKNAKHCHTNDMFDLALNRSYYAMFHSIQALLSSIGASLNKSHTGTHNAFHKEFIVTGIMPRDLGVALSSAYSSSGSSGTMITRKYMKKRRWKVFRMQTSLFRRPFNI